MGQQKVCVHLPGGLSTWTGSHCCCFVIVVVVVVFNVVAFVLLFCLGQVLLSEWPHWTGSHCCFVVVVVVVVFVDFGCFLSFVVAVVKVVVFIVII